MSEKETVFKKKIFLEGKIVILACAVFLILIFPFFVSAAELLEKKDFSVDPSYDSQSREKITAVLQRITSQLYFYVDESFWNSLSIDKQKEFNLAFTSLSQEFENKIYPVLTSKYGSEWKPGIDADNRITILIHPMKNEAAGYFNPGDEYPRAQVPKSNQREMVYLSSNYFTDSLNKDFLAHEFTHLITFNQKDNKYYLSEETWLDEARANFSSTLLGYDENFQDSNLQRLIGQFLESPQDPITEWQGEKSDYGALSIFTQYLVDYYGENILIDSLHSEKTGIASLNYALVKNGFSDTFSQAFTNWTIAVFVNNCSLGQKYCFLNDNLKNLKVTPFIYFLPTVGESTLSVGYSTKDWSGNWQKIIGGKGVIRLEFTKGSNVNFKVPYVAEDNLGKSVKFLQLDSSLKGTIYINNDKLISLTILPSIQEKTANFSDKDPSYQFFWSVANEGQGSSNNGGESVDALKKKIEDLISQITSLQAQIAALSGGGSSVSSCSKLENNLYFGMTNSSEVRCLQEFLKTKEPAIYPEGLVTGNFLSMTKSAVIKFQEKYAFEVLTPLGLQSGTGYVGSLTRAKMNSLMGK